jgi:phosphate transport system ATP-binding protein
MGAAEFLPGARDSSGNPWQRRTPAQRRIQSAAQKTASTTDFHAPSADFAANVQRLRDKRATGGAAAKTVHSAVTPTLPEVHLTSLRSNQVTELHRPGQQHDIVTARPETPIDSDTAQVEASLRALDPDAARPADVMTVTGLTLGFSGRTVLGDVNVALRRGSITALIGPTGSGKSTFLRTLNRMNDRVPGYSRTGEVTFDGTSLWNPDVDLLTLRRRVGMLFQRPNPFPMSIKDNVVAGVKAHRIAKGKQLDVVCERRLTEVGLWDAVKDRLSDSPFRLSGGQQQLLCLARALAVGPEVLLLDEPTSSLDPITTESIESLIRTLTPALSLIVVTHNLGQARRISDQTMFFFQGALVEHGPTESLFTQPEQVDTERYVNGWIG